MSPRAGTGFLLVLVLCVTAAGGSRREQPPALDVATAQARFPRQEPFAMRTFRAVEGERWIGNAIAYGPHRDGQHPGGPAPTAAQIREDLQLMSRHWGLLRMYGAVGPAETVLQVIRQDHLDMKLMLGIWIAVEELRDDRGQVVERFPEQRTENRREVEAAVRLAAAYPEIVVAVCVGNETQVFWSAHRSPPDILIGYVREVRARVAVPVTVADDFNFWNKPESQDVAREVDFIVTHLHPLWNGLALDGALDWTQRTFAAVQGTHPGRTVVLGETGWATRKHAAGDQARLIKGEPGEAQQQTFYLALTAWAQRERIPTFFFEAFDENWKGGPHPDDVEKHWGLYRADRTPKRAVASAG